ncbi:HEAT repeat domain-containing protein (plasmid) [Sinorhizobium meliloti]|uniref:HEAT repeat domain-containing protein n=1 Tax=Rhizobium meliloti TaxID=382 RepID=UPI000B4A1BA6|nr:HEAT repeat domain-containing protein [Sinorhizobium meliloti]ASP73857.1 HEAT repeat domain-containing protein [Sinorhizobium meliloti]MDE3858106.1 HEAT repeat domain-containing protein [Sinorhizobium meliloti]MQW53410.1 hypothetical protein [Sinorhizobium meliloti]
MLETLSRAHSGADGTSAERTDAPTVDRPLDPAEHLNELRYDLIPVSRFDDRDDDTLAEAALEFSNSTPLERERAAWELRQRSGERCFPLLVEMLRREPSQAVRCGLLWLVQKTGGARALTLLESFQEDQDPEIREWAEILTKESHRDFTPITGRRSAKKVPNNPFDQTLPLMISGFARTFVPQIGWVQATLSPLWFDSILGRVMACTKNDSFATALVIEKEIKSYFADGGDRHELYSFKGLTQAVGHGVNYHEYIGTAQHSFFLSGKVDDHSGGVVPEVRMYVSRMAITTRTTMHLEGADQKVDAVQSVRGTYSGFAYVSVERMLSNIEKFGRMTIGSGEVQLIDPHNAEVGHLANTVLFGTFKGKLSDVDGDGLLDINTIYCHEQAGCLANPT